MRRLRCIEDLLVPSKTVTAKSGDWQRQQMEQMAELEKLAAGRDPGGRGTTLHMNPAVCAFNCLSVYLSI